MSLPVQMAMKSSGAINQPPAVLPLQQQMQMMPHAQAQAQAQAQAMAQAQAQAHMQQNSQRPPAEVTSVLAETTGLTWLAIGSLAESLGDLDKASLLYDTALRHSPNNPEALTRLANIYRTRDHFLKAAELYEQALNFHPENGDTWGLLGHCYLMMDDLQRAYAAYQRALYYLENPNVPKLWHGIGILYDRYGLLEYAEEAFVRVLDLDPNFDKSNEIYFRLGIIYKHQGKLPSALECFQYILANPPHPLTQPDVWFQIGSVLEQQKNWTGAEEAYKKVLEVNPNHAKVLQQLGCLYSQAEAAPVDLPAQSGPPPFQQDLAVALKYLTQSIDIDSTDAHSWYYLGRVHMIRGDFNAAYEAFQQAVNRDSRNPTFWCSIGVLYYQISQYRDALDAYTRAIRLNPYISEVWYDLGTLYETCNNQISDALDAYRQAERLDPGNPHIQARLEQLIKYQQDGNTHPPQPPPVNQQPRLPQGMVLESTQPPQPSGPPGHPQSGALQQPQQLHTGPSAHPPAQLQLGQQPHHLQPHPQPLQLQPQVTRLTQPPPGQNVPYPQTLHQAPIPLQAPPAPQTRAVSIPAVQTPVVQNPAVQTPAVQNSAASRSSDPAQPVLTPTVQLLPPNKRKSPPQPTPVPQIQTAMPPQTTSSVGLSMAAQEVNQQSSEPPQPQQALGSAFGSAQNIITQPNVQSERTVKSSSATPHQTPKLPVNGGSAPPISIASSVSNGSLKHDLDDKASPVLVKRPNTAETILGKNDLATKVSPTPPIHQAAPQAPAPVSVAQAAPEQTISAPTAQLPYQPPHLLGSTTHQQDTQSFSAGNHQLASESSGTVNGITPNQSQVLDLQEVRARVPTASPAETLKGVSPKDNPKSAGDSSRVALQPITGQSVLTQNLPSNVDLNQGKTDAVNNDDEEEDDEEEEEKEPMEPPMRNVEEDENYDED
ncbi:TPR-like protein [Metschnikowia bicuspidata var. bicuspidata NRRL YB-4993]|uniref:TPR-like protein n=1 Tax=Metschnikowia bicuspidata var. bicuspidata NRRL YB-4993 TaxID=869754 RepID=A0A1A0H8T0_9ASCO|nr:TPR-like protein [Metschnikowia bicuspidata var. bicuspidata NRRL YB-4993]OBA20405.1 TPR-like protein [Metschnikowia bicuspidata var. bicuspidata NRRL YB-4993]